MGIVAVASPPFAEQFEGVERLFVRHSSTLSDRAREPLGDRQASLRGHRFDQRDDRAGVVGGHEPIER